MSDRTAEMTQRKGRWMNSHLLKSSGRRRKASAGVKWVLAASLLSAITLIWPIQCPAPIVYKAGEGWVYEEPKNGTNSWLRSRAIDQLRVASDAYDKKDFDLAFKAAQRTVDLWALSDYAPEAEYLLGKLYLKGQGVGKDVQQANYWLGEADRRGHLAAQLTRYAVEGGILDAPEQSFKALLLKAKGGDIEAQFFTAVLYALGEGTPQNPQEAKLWFVKAARQDRRHAAYCLAMLLLKQDAGTAADTAEAVSWLRKAADRGDASAQFELGDLYCKGKSPRECGRSLRPVSAWPRSKGRGPLLADCGKSKRECLTRKSPKLTNGSRKLKPGWRLGNQLREPGRALLPSPVPHPNDASSRS